MDSDTMKGLDFTHKSPKSGSPLLDASLISLKQYLAFLQVWSSKADQKIEIRQTQVKWKK